MHPARLAPVLTAALLPLSLVAAEEAPPTDATETLYISAGCPSDVTGNCESTRWLGKVTGDANSNYLTAVLPVDEALWRTAGDLNWRDYPSDQTLDAEGYLLDVDRDIHATVLLSANSQGGASAGMNVHARVRARLTLADGSTSTRTLEVPQQFVSAFTTMDGEVPVEFDFDIPDDLVDATLTGLTFEMAVRGYNVRAGYINQSGGSTVTIPHVGG